MPRRIRPENRQSVEPNSAVRGELRSVCQTNDSQRVGELLQRGIVSATDATACLESTLQHLPLMRMLLEHGADPAHIASTRYMSLSFDLVKLLVEFGYEISANGHCILQ